MSDLGVKTTHKQATTVFSILLLVSLGHFLNDTMQAVIPAIYPVIKENFNLSFSQIGIITLCFQMTSSIIQPFIGRYADKHPRPFSLSIAMIFTLIGLTMLCYANNFYTILISVCIIGMGSSIFHPEASRVAQMASGGKRGLAQSIFQVGGNAGTAAGPLLAALIIIPFGQTAIGFFDILAIVAFFIFIRIGFWYKRRIEEFGRSKKPTFIKTHSLTEGQVKKTLFLLLFLMFSKNFFSVSMTNYFTFYLINKYDVSIYHSQMALFAYLSACAAGIIAGGFLTDKFGRKLVILGSIFGAAPFTVIMPYVNSVYLCLTLAMLIGIIISSAFSAILVYATDLMPDKVGMIAGLFFGFAFGLGGIGSAFFGALADYTSIDFVFKLSTLLPLMGIFALKLPNISSKAKS